MAKAMEIYTAAGVTTTTRPTCGADGMQRWARYCRMGIAPIRFTCHFSGSNYAANAGMRTGFGTSGSG